MASLSAWALFISSLVLVFPMATFAGSDSLSWWFFGGDKSLCLLRRGGVQVMLIELF